MPPTLPLVETPPSSPVAITSCLSAAVGGRNWAGVQRTVALTALPAPDCALAKGGRVMFGPMTAAVALPTAISSTTRTRSDRRTGVRIAGS